MLTQLSLQITAVDVEPMSFDVEALRAETGDATLSAENLPVGALLLRSGPNWVVQAALSAQDSSGLAEAFKSVQAQRAQTAPVEWTPEPAVGGGMTTVLVPEITDVDISAPAPEQGVPYWILTIREADGNEIRAFFSDALARDVVRYLGAMGRGGIA